MVKIWGSMACMVLLYVYAGFLEIKIKNFFITKIKIKIKIKNFLSYNCGYKKLILTENI